MSQTIRVDQHNFDGWDVISVPGECWINIRRVSHDVAYEVCKYIGSRPKMKNVVVEYPGARETWTCCLRTSDDMDGVILTAEVYVGKKRHLFRCCRWHDWQAAMKHMVKAYGDIEIIMLTSPSLEVLKVDLVTHNNEINESLIRLEYLD